MKGLTREQVVGRGISDLVYKLSSLLILMLVGCLQRAQLLIGSITRLSLQMVMVVTWICLTPNLLRLSRLTVVADHNLTTTREGSVIMVPT